MMRKFEVTITYKLKSLKTVSINNPVIKQKKIIDVELDDECCFSPEQFCDSVINNIERPDVVRISIKEEKGINQKPLYWISEHFGRLYLYNGIPIVYHRN